MYVHILVNRQMLPESKCCQITHSTSVLSGATSALMEVAVETLITAHSTHIKHTPASIFPGIVCLLYPLPFYVLESDVLVGFFTHELLPPLPLFIEIPLYSAVF